jgi:LysR family transcriptional regulator, hypochlorite-specific transcription factor HypT
MDVDWLESFMALLDHGGFTKAAEAQHLSQPAFSRRIRALEHWLGAEVVDRSTFPVTLTPAGRRLREEASSVLAGLSSLRDEIRGRQLAPREAARVATSHTLATNFFAEWWSAMGSAAGPVPCRLQPTDTLEAYDALVHGGCELLLAYVDPAAPIPLDSAEWIRVGEDTFGPYSAVDGNVPAFELPGDARRPVPLLSHARNAFLGRVTDRLLAADPAPQLRPVMQTDLTEGLAQLAQRGVGVAWLPGLLVHGARRQKLVPVGDGRWTATLEIRLYRRSELALSPAAARVWELTGNRTTSPTEVR